jgi:hypothetical protein
VSKHQDDDGSPRLLNGRYFRSRKGFSVFFFFFLAETACLYLYHIFPYTSTSPPMIAWFSILSSMLVAKIFVATYDVFSVAHLGILANPTTDLR